MESFSTGVRGGHRGGDHVPPGGGSAVLPQRGLGGAGPHGAVEYGARLHRQGCGKLKVSLFSVLLHFWANFFFHVFCLFFLVKNMTLQEDKTRCMSEYEGPSRT